MVFLRIRVLLAFLVVASFSPAAEKPVSPGPYEGLEYRLIGPYRGGRVTAVAGVAAQPDVYYFGATGGGVFKTTDGGLSWKPITDQWIRTGSVGALAVAPSDANVLYLGMGESPVRGNVSHGDGVYKSVDAGKTWQPSGLADSRHISRIRVHPANPDIAYAAVMGHLFGPSEQRGVFKTTDGGSTWRRVLFRDGDTAAIDLVIDPNNPRILYAGLWQVRRTPYSLDSGGPGSGLFKSTDEGETWTEITRNEGFPKGIIGKVGITASAVDSNRLYAIVEAEEGGVFRSDNAGETWLRVSEDRNLRQRAWYYSRIYADPLIKDRVYVLNVGFHRSDNGGRTYTRIDTPHSDNHDLWIAPDNSNRMIEANDGGANISLNGGKSWTPQTQPTAQFYRVALDQDFPYNIYGAQQDNTTVRIASRTTTYGITDRHWWPVGGGESGWIAPDPRDSNIVYAGNYSGLLTRYDHRTGQSRNVTVYPDNPMGYGAEGMKYRFQWNFPILFSPHDPSVLYAAGNVLFKSTNEGQSWQAISPDLTRNDRTRQGPSGGPITKDNSGVEYYDTIFTVAESPKQKGVIWAGTDDGLVHLTRDGGNTWQNVTPAGLPEWIQVNAIEASPHDPAVAYFAATMYKSDDFRPYLYRTADYGNSWTKIVNGIAADAFTRVVREDPNAKGVLYAGTETGMYVSFNNGDNWQSLQLNMPVVPITDLALHAREDDLVVATQGRSFYVLDDLPALRQLHALSPQQRARGALLRPEDTYRLRGGRGGTDDDDAVTFGRNPPTGAVVHFWLNEKPRKPVTLEFLDAKGILIRKFESQVGDEKPASKEIEDVNQDPKFPVDKGLNRFVWNLRYPDAKRIEGMILWGGLLNGPLAVPGEYQVRITVEGNTETKPFLVRKDPRLATTPEDFEKQFELLTQLRDKLTSTHEGILRIRDVRGQLQDFAGRHKQNAQAADVVKAAQELAGKLTAIEEELYQTKNKSPQDPLNYPIKLNNKLAALAGVVASADARPTDQSYVVYEDLVTRINAQLAQLSGLIRNDLAQFNALVKKADLAAVVPVPETK
jgi:photosystem II stability/assembly factor-like uncharacterized protein